MLYRVTRFLTLSTLACSLSLGSASAAPTVPAARALRDSPLSIFHNRVQFLLKLPRHRVRVGSAVSLRARSIASAQGAPQYSIYPLSPAGVVSRLNQIGRALITVTDPSNCQIVCSEDSYVAFVNDRVPSIGLSESCPLACDPLGGSGGTMGYEYQFVANGLNNTGSVVGTWLDINAGGGGYAYINNYFLQWSLQGTRGSTQTYLKPQISPSNSFIWVGNAINDGGVAVGQIDSINPPSNNGGAARFYKGTVKLLPSPSGDACYYDNPTAINNAGVIVGFSQTSCGPTSYAYAAVAFHLSGPATFLPVKSPSGASAINSRGDVVGGSGLNAFLLRGSTPTYLPIPPPPANLPPNSTFLGASGTDLTTNDAVLEDSEYKDASGNYLTDAYLYESGKTYALNALIPANSGWQIIDAGGINDRGEIVGNGYLNGTLTPFVMKPAG